MATAILRIQIATLPDVADDASRQDGQPGLLVTVTSLGSGTTHALDFWDVYPSSLAKPALTTIVVGLYANKQWTFTLPSGYGRTLGLQLDVDAGQPGAATKRRIVAVPMQVSGLVVPLFAELADPLGTRVNSGANVIESSTDNTDGNWRGWAPKIHAAFERLEVLEGGGDWKASVRAATTAALAANTPTTTTLTANANGAFPNQDGIAFTVGTSLLVKNEAGATNGIFTLTDAGSGGTPWVLTRRSDADTDGTLTSGARVPIEEGGAVNGGLVFKLAVADPIVIGTTAQTWVPDTTAVTEAAVRAALALSAGAVAINNQNLTGANDVVLAGNLTPTSGDLDLLGTNGNAVRITLGTSGGEAFYVTRTTDKFVVAGNAAGSLTLSSFGPAYDVATTDSGVIINDGGAGGLRLAFYPSDGRPRLQNLSSGVFFKMFGAGTGTTSGWQFEDSGGNRLVEFRDDGRVQFDIASSLAASFRVHDGATTIIEVNTSTTHNTVGVGTYGLDLIGDVATIIVDDNTDGALVCKDDNATARQYIYIDSTNQRVDLGQNSGGSGGLVKTKIKGDVGFFNTAPQTQQTGFLITNNVTSGGAQGTFANWTDLTVYANDAGTIRNTCYRMGEAIDTIMTALRLYGMLS